jgi:threonylcarbamoyladenosine tRNA methylthiotransferase MtaB
MARKTSPDSFRDLLGAARAAIPELAVTTDVIVGFPGESESEFDESLEFVREQEFSGGHVFTYSAREGTAAARMPEQVPHPIRKDRNLNMRKILAESADRYQRSFLGKSLPALWETTSEIGPESWRLHGFTDNQLRVTAEAKRDIWNQITTVRIVSLAAGELTGIIL